MTGTSGNIQYNGGNVGIGTNSTNPPDLHNGNSPGLVIFGSYPALRLWANGAGARGYQISTGSIGQFTIIDSAAATSRLMIDSTGKVGVGTSYPTSRLHVSESTTANATQNDFGLSVTAHQNTTAGVTNGGRIAGIHSEARNTGTGTVAQVIGSRVQAGVVDSGTGIVNQAYGYRAQILQANGTVHYGYGVLVHDIQATNDYAFYQEAADDSNYFAGNVVMGATGATGNKLTVNGNIDVSGSITGASVIGATYQDLAEWVPATSDMEPGTVVVLNHDRTNEVMPSSRAYDTSVAGVVSAQPGIILGVGSDSKEQIATTGRVKVQVDATQGPIRVGDLLVTSDKPGYAMRSTPVDVAGISMHRPGTIVGKALEALPSGEGEILVLLSLQ